MAFPLLRKWLSSNNFGWFYGVPEQRSRKHPRTNVKARWRRRLLELEPLEDRAVPAIINVTTTADTVAGSLRDALMQVNSGPTGDNNTIILGAGTYTLSNLADGDLDIANKVTIEGAGAGVTIIDANGIDRVFQVLGTTVTFKNLTIQGGVARDSGRSVAPFTTDSLGGGILNEHGTVTLDHVTIKNNTALGGNGFGPFIAGFNAFGGGVYSIGGTVTVISSTFQGNSATGGDGLDGFDGANGPAGGTAVFDADDGTPGGNGLPAGAGGNAAGGGLYVNSGTVSIAGSTFTTNTVTGGKGGEGGQGGNGGKGGTASAGPGGDGGRGGDGGAGGAGGSATGGAIAGRLATLDLAETRLESNKATGGAGQSGGMGGSAGTGGDGYTSYSFSTQSGVRAQGGHGGASGAGGLGAGGGLYSESSAVTIRSDAASASQPSMEFVSNTVQGGAGGGLLTAWIFQQGRGGAGHNGGNGIGGGKGGDALGGAVAAIGGSLWINGASLSLNSNLGGKGGAGGVGGNSGENFGINPGYSGPGGSGGAGGDATGGGIYAASLGSALTITRVSVSGNTLTGGAGGNGERGGEGTFTSDAEGADGGVGGNGGVGGSARGGGIASLSPVLITSSTISGNSGAGGNGGNGADGGTAASGSDGITAFETGDNGGAGGNGGNGGTAGGVAGVGLFLQGRSGTSSMTNVTVVSNSALVTATGGTGGAGKPGGRGGEGGGLLADGDQGPNGTNGINGGATFTAGGGIYLDYNFSPASITINHATVVGNSAGVLGGVAILPGVVSIYNSIIAQNSGAILSNIDPNQILGANSNNFIGGNPNLGPLQDNGGPTLTRAPLAGSQAIDAGNDSAPGEPAFDQRGLPRKLGSQTDIGAVEGADGYVQITGSVPSNIQPGADVTYSLTLTVGDGVQSFGISNDFFNVMFGSPGSSYTLPSGWTPVTLGGDLYFNAPASLKPGIYNFTMTMPGPFPSGWVHESRVGVGYTRGGATLTQQLLLTSTVIYPQPFITSLSPSPTNEGSGFTLKVLGFGFGLGSKVHWNGAELGTSYISSTELRASVPDSLHDNGAASIKVVSPSPGGGTSNILSLIINNVAPTGSFADRFIAAPRSLNIGLSDVVDPSTIDSASLHYSYALSPAGLATTYASATDGTTKSFNFTATTTVYARIFDKDGGVNTYSSTVHLVTNNHAPVLIGANDLTSINEDDVSNNGVLVSSLIAGKITDTDPGAVGGIAVVGVSSGNGKWQYSINGGTTWKDFLAFSNTFATTLSATSTDRVRFVPNGKGPTNASISFRAWDLTNGGLTGDFGINTTNNGGGTAFSSAIAAANIRVTEVNDQPPAGQSYLAAMDQNTTLTIPLSTLFANISAGPLEESDQTLRILSAHAFQGGFQNDHDFHVVYNGQSLSVTPYDAFNGNFTIRVRFEDNGATNGNLDPRFQDMDVLVSVRQVNSPPIAVDDMYFTRADQGADIVFNKSLLTFNDSAGPWYEAVQNFTITTVSNAYGGTVHLDVDGTVTFTLDSSFTGLASFDYTIQDDGLTGGNPDPKTDTATFRVLVQPNNLTPATGVGPTGGRTYWGDYDADGDLDVLAIGLIDSDPDDSDPAVDDPVTSIYRNDGNGVFTVMGNLGLPAMKFNAAPQWIDFNKDGYLDLLFHVDGIILPVPELYVFDVDAGQFTDSGVALTTLAGITWIRIDSHLGDIVGPQEWVLKPNPNATMLAFQFAQLENDNYNPRHEFIWADYNSDGFLDVVAFGAASTRIYRNDANNGLTQVTSLGGSATIDWADFDEDGDLDLLLSSGVYVNEGNDVFSLMHGLTNVQHAVWGDVTGDGKLDIVYSTSFFTAVDRYTGAGFERDQSHAFNVLSNGNWIALGDHDRDGDLDILLDGNLYINFGAPRNQAPPTPINLTVEMLNSSTARFSWTQPSDDSTSNAALTYTIRLGTTPGGSEIMAPRALPSGVRQLSDFGLLEANTLTITGLTRGQTYYWTVQAVDGAFVGSAFAAEQSFLAECLPTSSDTTLFFQADHPSPLGFPFQDLDFDQLHSVEITTLPNPTIGRLFLNGMPLTTPGTTVSRDDLRNLLLVFRGWDEETTEFTETSFDFRVTSKNPSGAEFVSPETYTATVFVFAAATEPILTAADVSGGINTPVSLNIAAQLVDTDGSETLSIKIDGVPGGVSLSAGTDLNGVWYLTPAQLSGLTLTGQSTGAFTLTVTATASESNSPITASTVKTFDVTLTGPVVTGITIPNVGVEGTPVLLEVDATSSGQGTLTYTWTIINQADQSVTQLSGAAASFTASDDGLYRLHLKIEDSAGGSLTTNDRFLSILNADPELTLGTADMMVAEGESFNLDPLASFSDLGYGSTETFRLFINWGDGSVPIENSIASIQVSSPTTGSISAGHTFADDGVYMVSVVLMDDDGGVAFKSFTVTVGTANPVLNLVDDQTIEEGQTLTVPALATFTDAGFKNLALGTDETFSYSIDWGDSSNPTTGVASVTQIGSAGTPTAGGFGGGHTYLRDGNYTVTVTITDDDGGQDIRSFQVTVDNVPPTITDFDIPDALTDGATVNLSAVAEAVRLLNYTWTITPPTGPAFMLNGPLQSFSASAIGTYTVALIVDDGDGSTDSASGSFTVTDDDVSGPSITITNAADDDITGASETASRAGAAFRWTTTDSSGVALVAATITKDGEYVATVRSGGQFSLAALPPGTYFISISATDGDNDRPGDPSTTKAGATMTITNAAPSATGQTVPTTEDTPVDITLSGSDADLDELVYEIVNAPTSGVLSGAGASRTYTSGPNFSGSDSFTYKVVDPFGGESETVTVHINVTAAADTPGLSITAASGDEAAAIPLSIAAALNDTDGSEILAITLENIRVGARLSNTAQGTSFFISLDGATSVTLAVADLAGLTITAPDDADFTLKVTARTRELANDDAASATANLAVEVTNRNPAIGSIVNTGPIDENSSATVTVTAEDVAGNYDPLLYEFDFDNDGIFEVGPQADNWASAAFTDSGIYRVNVRVTDGDNGVATGFTNVVVNGTAPIATIARPTIGVPGQVLTFTLGATDASPADQAGNFTWTIKWGDGATETVIGPDGATVMHTYTTIGTKSIALTAQDKDGTSSTEASANVVIQHATVTADPLAPAKNALFVGGTNRNDLILILPYRNDVRVWLNGKIQGTFIVSGHIFVFGLAGNDRIVVAGVQHDAILDGGSGNDRLRSSTGNDILLGGAGNDRLQGGTGNNILIGGVGRDTLSASKTRNVLAGGTTNADDNIAALDQAMIALMRNDSLTGLLMGFDDGERDVLAFLNDDILLAAPGDRVMRKR